MLKMWFMCSRSSIETPAFGFVLDYERNIPVDFREMISAELAAFPPAASPLVFNHPEMSAAGEKKF